MAGPWTFGSVSRGQGSRSDLMAVAEAIKAGQDLKAVAEHYPVQFIKFNKGLSLLHATLFPLSGVYSKKSVYVRWGPTGTGKTRWAYHVFGKSLFRVPSLQRGSPWFDGYTGEESALFDDYAIDNKLTWSLLLHVTDGYAIRVPVKGGFVIWCPKNVIFTSNTHWNTWYPEIVDQSPFKRRISEEVEHTKEWLPDDVSEEFMSEDSE